MDQNSKKKAIAVRNDATSTQQQHFHKRAFERAIQEKCALIILVKSRKHKSVPTAAAADNNVKPTGATAQAAGHSKSKSSSNYSCDQH